MRLVNKDMVDVYLREDTIAFLLDQYTDGFDDKLACQRWLRETPAKRLIYQELYGDLLKNTGRRVLDVGGGLTSLTRILARQHRYELIEMMAHDNAGAVTRLKASVDRLIVHISDWYEFQPMGAYDIVAANDLFPNVDQRLDLFIEKFIPHCHELRLSLTFYEEPRFYTARRIDGEELLCLLAWDGRQTKGVIEKYVERVIEPDLDMFIDGGESVVPNGRQVCLVTIKGAQCI